MFVLFVPGSTFPNTGVSRGTPDRAQGPTEMTRWKSEIEKAEAAGG